MKRILALLLAAALLLPLFPTVVWAEEPVAYEALASVPYRYNGTRTVAANKEIFSYGMAFDTPIDLTAHGYPASGAIEAGVLGLQMDICVSGRSGVPAAMENGITTGQLEITSSATCDKDERAVNVNVLPWKANAWNRVVIDLSQFTVVTGGTFDPTCFNYMRMYIGGLGDYVGKLACVKIANVQIVDLSTPLDIAPALGDGTAADEVPAADQAYDAPAYVPLAEVPYSAATFGGASGEVFSVSSKMETPIDLTAWGYPVEGVIETGVLGLQFDYYIAGGSAVVTQLENGQLSGQIEITSSGTCDVEERGMSPHYLKGKAGEWSRVVLDLGWFTSSAGGTFDPAHFNYLRMYFSLQTDHPDARYTIKVCNARLVDLTQPLAEEETPLPGDGTFAADAPQFAAVSRDPAFVTDTAVVAGYNLKEYAATHGMGDVADWSPIIQSLLYGSPNRRAVCGIPTASATTSRSPIATPRYTLRVSAMRVW